MLQTTKEQFTKLRIFCVIKQKKRGKNFYNFFPRLKCMRQELILIISPCLFFYVIHNNIAVFHSVSRANVFDKYCNLFEG